MGRSADTQGANQPDHDGNSQYQAKNAAEADPALHAVAIVATASEQQNQQDDNQNCTHVTPSLKCAAFKAQRQVGSVVHFASAIYK